MKDTLIAKDFKSVPARFWNFVEKTDTCWLWTGYIRPDGYGTIEVGNFPMLAHRVGWIVQKGPIPQGLQVCHHCDIRHCVRYHEEHLFLGTQKDNILDMISKGRRGELRGEKHGFARLTTENVLAAREWYAQRGYYRVNQNRIEDLATKLGVDRKTLSDAIHGKTWKHLPQPQTVNRKTLTPTRVRRKAAQ